MSITIIMPQIGQSIAEATVVKWFKKPGERVEKGETLLEIGTDKINTEIPAPQSGIVQKLLVQEGQTVPIHTAIAELSNESESIADSESVREPEQSKEQRIRPPDSSLHVSPGDRQLSPFVRRLAEEHNIDVTKVKGSGLGGRVTKEDMLKVIEEKKAIELSPAQSSAERGSEPAIERVPMSRMRKLIAEHMTQSRQTAADVTTFFEVDMTEVVGQREKGRQIFRESYGLSLTYLPFIIAAAVKALQAFPIVNSSIEGDDILYKKEINIGVAVALESGLIVPVILHADEKNILDLARALQDLSERAKNKRLTPDDLANGTFTITNPGVFGAVMGTPIIHQPQVAILGVGAVTKKPVVVDDQITIRSMAFFSLSYDHRAMDGATADQFLAHMKQTLENECPPALD